MFTHNHVSYFSINIASIMKKPRLFLILVLTHLTIACNKIEITSDPQVVKDTTRVIPPVCDEFLTKSLACIKKNTPSLKMHAELEQEDKIRRARWAATPYQQMESSCKQMLNAYNQDASKIGC